MASRWAPSWESDAMQSKTLSEAEERMKKAIEFVRHELAGIRTGKASPQLLDTVKVEAYGTHVPLQQVGSVSAPQPRLLVIQPWDKSLIKAICRGVNEAQLGLNPTDDGSLVRIPIPTLTEERRKDLVKLISKFAEEGGVAVRQVRHDANKELKGQEDGGTLPADDAKRQTAEVQKMTDRSIAQIDELLKKKTAEVMEVYPRAKAPRRRDAERARPPSPRLPGDALPTRTPPGPQELIARGNIPRHVAIIMDGNGRWAKARGGPRLMGHRAGRESVREAVRGCAALGVDVLTLYTFSIENWQRPARGGSALMTIWPRPRRADGRERRANTVRLPGTGGPADLPAPVREEIAETQRYL